MKIPANRLDRPFLQHQLEYEESALRVLRSGWYVLGKEVSAFENEFATFVGAKHCVGLASGLDALWIAFRLLDIGVGDEVITQANTYIASVMGITINRAMPVLVEPDEFYNLNPDNIEAAITPKTKAILAVNLYGQACDMESICNIAKRHNLYVIEDCAQSHGAMQNGVMTGNYGDVGCFSFYPSKNLGAFGDAGAVTVKSEKLAEDFRTYRNYGSEKRYYNKVVGTNSRLDELQAAMLRVRLKHLNEMNLERAKICERYFDNLNHSALILPKIRDGCHTVWHQFVVRVKDGRRQALIDYLSANGIGSIIHYPVPPHLSKAYTYLGYKKGDFPITESYADSVLSLPLFNGMTEDEQAQVIETVNKWEG